MMFSLNLVQQTNEVIDISQEITTDIDRAVINQSENDYKERGSGKGDVAYNRIGSGYIGHECARYVAHKYHRTKQVPVIYEGPNATSQGELKRHAYFGFDTEDRIASWLRLSGFTLHDKDENGTQLGYKHAPNKNGQARLAGEIDGMITGYTKDVNTKSLLTDILDKGYPVFWESKKMTDKKWCKFAGVTLVKRTPATSKGVKEADLKYYGQVQTNMVYMPQMKDVPYEWRYTLFTGLNFNNMKPYAELVPLDLVYAQKLSDRAAKILETQTPEEMAKVQHEIPKKGLDKCAFCEFRWKCWE